MITTVWLIATVAPRYVQKDGRDREKGHDHEERSRAAAQAWPAHQARCEDEVTCRKRD
jgi:hypothetical protein